MENIIVEIMNQYGYLGIGFLIAIENLFPPIPSEVILTLGGFMTTYTGLNVWLVILSATIGSVSGALVLYSVGRLVKPEALKSLISGKVGNALYLKPEDISKAGKWFAGRGNLTVLFCRFIPIVRSLISIPAGTANMKLSLFLTYTVTGTAIWNAVLVWLGVFAGRSWEKVVEYASVYSAAILLMAGIFVLLFGFVFYKSRIRKRQKNLSAGGERNSNTDC